jgi:hypothetical protein
MSTVAILNVGEGDTKISFDKKNPAERKRAAKIVTDMLKRGYALMIEVGKRKGEPIYQRVKKFDPETCEYIVMGGPEDEIDLGAKPHAKKKRAKKKRTRRVAAEKTTGVSVPRTAGGCPPRDQEFADSFDRLAPIRNAMRKISAAREEWAGVPMPLEGEQLIVDPSYRFAEAFEPPPERLEHGDFRIRNVFWSQRYRMNAIVYEKDGKSKVACQSALASLDILMRTMGCSVAWGVEQEHNALMCLADLVRHHTFKMVC